MKFGFNEILSREDVVTRIAESDIFFHYLGIEPILGVFFRNPLRDDNKAGCRFYFDDREILKFKDFATGWNWDCFNVVQYIYQCNFGQAINIIAEDFKLKELSPDRQLIESTRRITKQQIQNTKNIIQVKFRDWRTYDLDYWNKYHIDLLTLQLYNVYPIEYAWFNNEIIYRFKGNDIGYAYYFGNDEYKLYFPNRSRNSNYPRFYHTNSNLIQGASQLDLKGNQVVITKSLKDVMCMHLFGIPSIAPMSESILITSDNFAKLSQRFKIVYTLFDRDRSGKLLSKRMRDKYNTIPLLFPSDHKKDFSDNLKEYGIQYINDMINDFNNGE